MRGRGINSIPASDKSARPTGLAVLILAAACALVRPASADDTLKLAVSQNHNWENQAPLLGRDAGVFKQQGIVLEVTAAYGAADALQATISGAADIAVGIDSAAVLRAFAKGAPIRVLLANFTGASDLYWYVKSDSQIGGFKDTTDSNTIAYSTDGSLSHRIVTEFARDLDIKAKPVAVGSPAAALIRVMSGTIDLGWARAPFGLKEAAEGKIRIVGRGSDIAAVKARTLRVTAVNAEALRTRKDAVLRFVRAYREAVDWLYVEPKAMAAYAEQIHLPPELVADSIRQYHPKAALQTETVLGLDETMREAVRQKVLDATLSKEQLGELLQIPPRR